MCAVIPSWRLLSSTHPRHVLRLQHQVPDTSCQTRTILESHRWSLCLIMITCSPLRTKRQPFSSGEHTALLKLFKSEQLKPIYDKKYICGDVSPLYSIVHQLFELLAHHYMITNLAGYYGVCSHQRSWDWYYLSHIPQWNQKALQTKGVIPEGRGSSLLQRIANKFVGRRKVPVFLTFIYRNR